ncbi:MAG: amino acid adenylation domain-containing protein [Pseudomonadota bacterium]
MADQTTLTPPNAKEIAEKLHALPAEKRRVFRQRLAERGIDGWRLPIVPFGEAERKGTLSRSQARLLTVEHANQADGLYNLSAALKLDGALDLDALRTAFSALLHRHQILRSTYQIDEAGARQTVMHEVPDILTVSDELPDELSEEQVASYIAPYLSAPFDLSTEPPIRAVYFRREDGAGYLLLVVHHIAFDAWSEATLVRHLLTAYIGAAAGQSAEAIASEMLGEGVQFADYAQWEADWLESDAAEADRRYWSNQLADLPEPIRLPADRKRLIAKEQTSSGAEISKLISAEQAGDLRALTAREDTTLYTLLQAVFSLLLSRYGDQDDLVIGTAAASRARPELEETIGFLVNTLPLRHRVDWTGDFRHHLAQTKSIISDALGHQLLPFDEIVEVSSADRSTPGGPLFQTLFIYQNVPAARGELAGLEVSSVALEKQRARFDLTLRIMDIGDNLRLDLEYSTELFDEASVQSLLDEYAALISQVIADPAIRLSGLRLSHEPGPIDGAAAEADHVSALDLFMAAPDDAPALLLTGSTVTYGDLRQRAASLASRFGELETDTVIAIYLEPGSDQIAAMIAAWMSGATWVVLDPNAPPKRLTETLDQLAVRAVFGEGARTDWVKEDISWIDVSGPSAAPINAIAKPAAEQAAYIIMTSGSTGRPKPVGVPHRALAAYVAGFSSLLPLGAEDVLSALAAPHTDLGFTGLFGALLSGKPFRLLSQSERDDPSLLASALARVPSDLLKITPSHLQALLDLPAPERLLPRKALILGGEAARPDLIAALHKIEPDLAVWNHYGPAETTIGVAMHPIELDVPGSARHLSRVMAGTRLHVFDQKGRPTPIGAEGELWISGAQLAIGYRGQPVETADRFVEAWGDRWYRTGDRVRRMSDGAIAFVGRADQQIKIRGFRIELAELEAAAMSLDGISGAAACAIEIGANKRLGLVVRPDKTGETLPEDAIRTALDGMLSPAMIPHEIVFVEALPQLGNGKIDRKSLSALFKRANQRDILDAAGNETAQQCAELFADLLGQEVGLDDGFFASGGDSLLALQLSARARKLGLAITPLLLLEHQTPRALSLALKGSSAEHSALTVEALGPFGLSPIQSWFFEQDLAEPGHWNQSLLLEADLEVEAHTLRRALADVIAAYPMLRACFKQSETGWTQEVARIVLPAFEEHDLRESGESLEACLRGLQRPFDLGYPPLFRAALIHTAEQRFIFFTAHHLIVDTVSWRLLLDGVLEAYTTGRVRAFEATTYRQWVSNQANAEADLLDRARDYAETLSECRAPFECDPGRYADAVSQTIELSQAHTAEFQELSLYTSGGAEAVLLTALSVALSEQGVTESLAVELERHGRGAVFGDLSGTIGWHTSRFPFALQIPDREAQSERWLATISDQLNSVPDDGIGFGIVRYLKGEFTQLADPDLVLNYRGASGQVQPGIRRSTNHVPDLRSPQNKRSRLIDINGDIENGALRLVITAPEKLSDVFDMIGFSAGLQRALEKLVSEVKPQSDYSDTRAQLGNKVEGEIEAAFPLTPVQTGMLLHSLSRPDSGAYINQLKIEFEGNYSIALMKRAWADIIARHDILRAGFHLQDLPEPMHAIMSEADLPFRVIEGGDVEQTGREDAAKGFDFIAPPLMRLSLVTHSPKKATLIWTRHHLITDGWSTAIVLKEVQERYFELALAEQSNRDVALLPAPQFSFGDFARWRARQDDAEARIYWRDLFETMDEPLRLPKLAQPDQTGAREIRETISKTETDQLKVLAATLGVTLGALTETAFALALARFGRGRDIVFGQVMAGRPLELEGIDKAVGAFLTTVPVRADLSGHDTLEALARSLHRQTVQAQTHGGMALSDIQTEAGLGRDGFDALFIYENYPTPDTASLDEGAFRIHRDIERNVYPLTLMAAPGDELALNLVQERAAISSQLADELIAQLRKTLSALARIDGEAGATPTRKLLETGESAPASSFGKEDNFGDCAPMGDYLSVGDIDPSRPAIKWLGSDTQLSLSRKDLDARANQLAHHLIELGVKRGDRVCVDMLRGPEMMIGLLAILKAGGAYVPLERGQPINRRRLIAEITRAQFVLHQPGTDPDLGDHVRCVEVDTDASCAAKQPVASPKVFIAPNDAAYVLFTSGSTGEPKGVAVPHQGLWNRLRWMQSQYGFGPQDRLIQKTPYSFDVSVFELFLPLLSGAELIMAPPEAHKDPQALSGLIEQIGVTTAHFVPSMLSVFLDQIERAGAPTSLNRVICSGETLGAGLASRARELLGCEVHNLYGPTEASIDVTYWDTAQDAPDAVSPIGEVISNMAAYVLDDQLQPVPDGVTGELYLSGIGLATGYEQKPGLTASAFLPNPHAKDPSHSRLYRTGDLARWRKGALDFLGRADFQVKLRGQRIELGEIETALERHSAVSQAVVIVHEAPAGERLVAYIVSADGSAEETALRQHLSQTLPAYMIPAQLVELDALPLNANGKLDRKGLPAPDPGGRVGDPPQTETEIALAEIWSDILRVGELSRDDHFFFVGGHSLLLPRLLDAANRRFGTSLGFIDIALALTITAQAEIVDAALARAAVFDTEPEDDSDEDRVVFDL